MTFSELFFDSIGKRICINWLQSGQQHMKGVDVTLNYDIEVRLEDAYIFENETKLWLYYKYLRIVYDSANLNTNYGINPADTDAYPNFIVSSDGITWSFLGFDFTFSIDYIKIYATLTAIRSFGSTLNYLTASLIMGAMATNVFGYDVTTGIDEYWESTYLVNFESVFYQYTNERDLVNKESYLSMYYVTGGQLTEECDILNPSLLFQIESEYLLDGSLFDANYVYIKQFHRYYWITKITNVRNDLWRVDLHVDVLYTYNTDIRKQSAFIVRNEKNPYSIKIADDRWTFASKPTYTFSDKTGGTLANITFTPQTASNFNIVLSVINDYSTSQTQNDVTAPTGSTLNNISTAQFNNTLAYNYALSSAEWKTASREIANQQTLASFIFGAWAYPFEFSSANNVVLPSVVVSVAMKVGTTTLTTTGATIPYDVSNYLILADFTMDSYNNFYDIEPYKVSELYIPYYNGTYPINRQRTAGHRILVFYTCQFSSGQASVYVYDVNDKQILMSAPVQLAQKLPISTTNNYEIELQRTLLNLSLTGKTLDAVYKIGFNAIAKNPLGVIAGAQNFMGNFFESAGQSAMLQDTAQVGVVSTNTGIFNPQKCYLITKSLSSIVNDTQKFYDKNGYPIQCWDVLDDGNGHAYTGYTELSQIHYKQYTQKYITTSEISELEELAKNGIIL